MLQRLLLWQHHARIVWGSERDKKCGSENTAIRRGICRKRVTRGRIETRGGIQSEALRIMTEVGSDQAEVGEEPSEAAKTETVMDEVSANSIEKQRRKRRCLQKFLLTAKLTLAGQPDKWQKTNPV